MAHIEYHELYKLLYDTLHDVFPKEIIKTIIFSYATTYNEYAFKYKHLLDCKNGIKYNIIHNPRHNEQLDIIYYLVNSKHKLINYHDGLDHDGSLIDIKSFNKLFNKSQCSRDIVYFKNNVILMISTHHKNYSTSIIKYILNGRVYKMINQTCICDTNIKNCDTNIKNINIYNDRIYCVSPWGFQNTYMISIYNFNNLELMHETKTFTCIDAYMINYSSIHNDVIYICCENPQSRVIYFTYAHDINTLNRIHKNTIDASQISFSTRLHKNKIYYIDSQTLHIYDILTKRRTLTINIKQYFDYGSDDLFLATNDDLILMTNRKEIVTFSVKSFPIQ
jgi:hypothetical protein